MEFPTCLQSVSEKCCKSCVQSTSWTLKPIDSINMRPRMIFKLGHLTHSVANRIWYAVMMPSTAAKFFSKSFVRSLQNSAMKVSFYQVLFTRTRRRASIHEPALLSNKAMDDLLRLLLDVVMVCVAGACSCSSCGKFCTTRSSSAAILVVSSWVAERSLPVVGGLTLGRSFCCCCCCCCCFCCCHCCSFCCSK